MEEERGKNAWPSLIADIDAIGQHLAELASTVVGRHPSMTMDEKDKQAVKWAAELEWAIISVILGAEKKR